ncbi:helix-turn-helix transcriptional regulator [Rhodoblastus sp.]|uniref:helix-turn-helix transcriptional regulator n=1 Tax=Rhodoblastus sp. TaxID=1962975 RepID=UPI003F97B0B8
MAWNDSLDGRLRRHVEAPGRPHSGAEIVQAARMRRAQRLLATSKAPVAEVALRVGYADPSNFHRAFVALTGMTPGQFRTNSRELAPVD